MWSRLTQLFTRGHIQHHRIRGAAVTVLLVRLVEGAACWTILTWFFREVISSPWTLHLTFIAYACANLGLFALHPVSYTHLTLPTTLRVWISVVAVSFKKKR